MNKENMLSMYYEYLNDFIMALSEINVFNRPQLFSIDEKLRLVNPVFVDEFASIVNCDYLSKETNEIVSSSKMQITKLPLPQYKLPILKDNVFMEIKSNLFLSKTLFENKVKCKIVLFEQFVNLLNIHTRMFEKDGNTYYEIAMNNKLMLYNLKAPSTPLITTLPEKEYQMSLTDIAFLLHYLENARKCLFDFLP